MHSLLFITPNLDGVGGQQRSVSQLCSELAGEQAFSITLVSLCGETTSYPLDRNINVVFLERPAAGKTVKNRMVRFLFLLRFIRKSNFDLIIGYGAGTRLPVGVLNQFFRIPIVFCDRSNPAFRYPSVIRRLRKSIGTFLIRHTNAVFQTGNAAMAYKKLNKTIIIPNLIDDDKLPEIADWASRSNKVISLGRYELEKNQKLLIRAFASTHVAYPQYILELYGDGELAKDMAELIRKLDAEDYITLKSSVLDVFGTMNAAKIYVCSSDTEGYPNALLEAMAMGMACVSTECGGSIRDMINDGVSGLIVPVGDAESMSKALISLMKNDNMAREMANRAIAVRERNSKERIIDDWSSFFCEVLRES